MSEQGMRDSSLRTGTGRADDTSFEPVFPGISVIDCDSHYTEPPDLWTSRAPASLRDRVPRLRQVDGRDLWYVDDDVLLGPVGFCVVSKNGKKVLGRLHLDRLDELAEAAHDPAARVQMLDKLGIGAQILYPNVAGFASSRFLAIEDAKLRTACVRIYNDAVAELQAASQGRLFPQAILPFWDLGETLSETRRIREELGLSGVTITDRPEHFGLPDYGEEAWEPFWELAEEFNLPLNFHIGSGGSDVFSSSPWPSMGPERKIAIGATLLYIDNARMIANLLYSDLLERHPGLRFVSVESGLGWIPFILEACEYQWDEMVPTEVKGHQLRPTEKFRRNIYACFWFEDEGPRRMIERIGVRNVLFETDFPHPTCLYPNAREHLRNVLGDLSDETRRRVLYENAAELYGISLG